MKDTLENHYKNLLVGAESWAIDQVEVELAALRAERDAAYRGLTGATKEEFSAVPMNNTYKITVESPLVRPGLKLETECSEKYVVAVVAKAMELVREINAPKAALAKGAK